MTIPAPAELRAQYAVALEATQMCGDAAVIRAVVAMFLPEEDDLPSHCAEGYHHRQSQRRRTRHWLLSLAELLGRDGLHDSRQAVCDALADQEQADG